MIYLKIEEILSKWLKEIGLTIVFKELSFTCCLEIITDWISLISSVDGILIYQHKSMQKLFILKNRKECTEIPVNQNMGRRFTSFYHNFIGDLQRAQLWFYLRKRLVWKLAEFK